MYTDKIYIVLDVYYYGFLASLVNSHETIGLV